MKQDSWEIQPSSFTETIHLVENFVRQEIALETNKKQLYYHTIDHAISVQRRASHIFDAIESVIPKNQLPMPCQRLKSLIKLCALAHDMVQHFAFNNEAKMPRKRIPGISETATANKLIKYIEHLNQSLLCNFDSSIMFSDLDLIMIKDGILATICDRDPQAGKADYSFSPYSIYQPYLYHSSAQTSIVGQVIALADLGALGIDGIRVYIQEGILVFIEDNLDLKNLILNSEYPQPEFHLEIKQRLLKMTRFMVNLAQERKARFELEISGFNPEARQILREKIFIHLNSQNIAQLQDLIPTQDSVSLKKLIDFFHYHNILHSN